MKRVPLQVSGSVRQAPLRGDWPGISPQMFVRFKKWADVLDEWDDVVSATSLRCEKCGAYLTNIAAFLYAAEEVVAFLDSISTRWEFERFEGVLSAVSAMLDQISEFWDDSFDDQSVDESDLAVLFDMDCSCIPYLLGTDEPRWEVSPEREDLLVGSSGDKSIRIYKHIGPKRR